MSEHITPKTGAGMSNIDKAAQIIAEAVSDTMLAEVVALALDNAGLIECKEASNE